MGERLIKPYEISVWEDKLIQNGADYEFVENKLAVIGSDTMTGLNRVYDPVFNKKTNGERTLSFSLRYKYFDPYIGNDDIVNPFADLLVNERKVKLHYDDQWYEFIIKDHSESSDGLEWTYTCTDAFVLELSKNGYNITFDSELNNNQGTAAELAKETLKDTDWRLGGVDNFKQLIAEPIYKGVVQVTFDVLDTDTNRTVPIAKNTEVYVFYSYVKNKDGKFVQFIKKVDDDLYVIDSNNVITATNYRITRDNITVTDTAVKSGNTPLITINEIETKFQANRLAYNQLTTYDPVMERTVDRFKVHDGDLEIYKYNDYAYTTSNVVMNYVTNGDNFNELEDGSLQGWNPYTDQSNNATVKKLELVTKPELGIGKKLVDLNQLSEIQGFLKVQFNGAGVASGSKFYNTIYNSGIENNTAFIKSISKGDKFVFRWRAGTGNIDNLIATTNLRAIVAKYTQDTPTRFGYYYKHINPNDIVIQFTGTPVQLNNIITGGTIVTNEDEEHTQSYVIDDVPQTPSIKYIYVSNNQQYVWNGVTNRFDIKTNSNYLPYYYIIGEAIKGVSNATLTDSTQDYGLFIYNTSGAGTYYFQDIQLTRFVPDSTDSTGNTPILIGNIPTATSNETSYYYVKPARDVVAEDITTYTSLDELKNGEGLNPQTIIDPLYNGNSEKNLSISVSQSNCFNILQTIAETFECWIDLVVDHDNQGYITSTNGKLNKFVYLRDYVGVDNWAGFKYGINVNSIERTINSDEIVTKLIVDQSQSEYAKEGYISIGAAPSNQSGESYLLNFDYYYNQKLLDRDKAEADKLKFFTDVSKINQTLKDLNQQKADKELALTEIGSKRNVYTELVQSAQDTRNESLEKFEQLTGRTYEQYQALQKTAILYADRYYILTQDITAQKDKSYYTYGSGTFEEVEDPSGNPKQQGWYETLVDLSEEETVLGILGEIYTCSATINNYSGLLTNIEKEYWRVRKELYGSENYKVKIWTEIDFNNQRHVCVELNDYLSGFKFVFGGNTYTSTLSQKYFDITNENDTYMTFTAPTGYTVSQSTYDVVNDKIQTIKLTSTQSFDGVEDLIEQAEDNKVEKVKNFNNKYSRFIQEGTWSSTDYIDSEKYYLDALQVSNTSAQPTVSYTINVVEVSQLEGLELYSFDAGDKSYIEDTEFFGWANVDGNLTPAREEVIVSEVEWHLDRPEENVITVQNYKTRFEDLFQRISATVQTVQYNEATYAKMSSLLDANGTINQNVLLDSLNKISGESYALTSDGSVVINKDQILVRNLTNPANCVILNSEGLRISSDGGKTWKTAISGEGINAGAVYTGTLNTQNIIIGSTDNPSFRWDKSGISAYKLGDNNIYDLKTFVRYDQYGLYGIQNSAAFKPQGETFEERLRNVKETAHFAVTWDGFFIKNSYAGGGRVEITSDNDFRVLSDPANQGNFLEKIKIGALEWGKNGNVPITDPSIAGATALPTLYGIRISNNNGQTVMKTGDDGNLELTGTLNATAGNFSGLVNVGPENQDHIIIDGREGINSPLIQSSNYSDGAGTGWMINKDGDAYFMNITARGAIKTAVFEYAEIEAVGGLFVFRPSSTIKSARISGNDLVVKVEKPFLFETIKYTEIENPSGNPKSQGWYEQGKYGYIKSEDTTVDSEKTYFSRQDLFHSWCKISNYNSEGVEADVSSILSNNGLSHVYEISDISNGEITLKDAAPFVEDVRQEGQTQAAVLKELEGGALIDFGREAGTSGYDEGRHNYGIGINSSDNTVNLPERAISLFETVIHPDEKVKVSYDYRGILGTLPVMEYTGANPKVNPLYHNYMEKTQGIYTDNMYIGDKNQYLAFYTDNNGDKHLKISARDMVFGYDEETGEEITWEQKIDEATQGSDAAQVVLTSTIGEQLVDGVGQGAVYARLYIGKQEDDPLKTFVFTTTPPDLGSYYYHLNATNKTCTLKKKVNGTWVDAPSEDQPKYNYVWTFRDESGQPTTYNGYSSITGKAIYMDGDIVNNKIVLQCDVSDL